MNTSFHESERVPVSLETVWRALTALGHQRLWLRPPDERSVNTWLIVTWDGLTVAERIRNSGTDRSGRAGRAHLAVGAAAHERRILRTS